MTRSDHEQEQLDPATEEAAVHAALKRGDASEAFEHAAALLARAPASRPYQRLVEQVVRAADTLDELFDPELDTRHELVVAGAFSFALRGDFGPALALLMKAACQEPTAPSCGAWLEAWFPNDAALKQVPASALGHGLLLWTKRSFARDVLDPAERAAFEPFRPLVEKLCRIHHRQPELQSLASTLLRKVGRKKVALLLAQRAQKQAPCAASHVAVGLAYRALGDRAAAIRALRAALKADPQSGVLMADMGDLYLELGETGPATTWYERAERQGATAYAEAGLCAVRHREGLEGHWLNRLRELAAGHEQVLAGRARALIAALGEEPPSEPYEDFIPDPGEAAYNLLRELIRRHRAGEPLIALTTAGSAVEAPSVWLAFDLFERTGGGPRPAIVRAPGSELPGVGRPLREVTHLLWSYPEGVPQPCVGPPRPDVQRAVEELARRPFHVAAWGDLAADVARDLTAANAIDLLGCMVHPEPLTPEWTDCGYWVRAQQHAAALIVARLGGGPWEGSLRRQVLHDLLFGPLDWTVEAAVVAASWAARQDAAAAEDVGRWFEELAGDMPPLRRPYEAALRACGLRLPGLTHARRRLFEGLRDGLSAPGYEGD